MQEQNVPLVSIIIAAYNAELFIHETLNSLYEQTYNNFEIIVINDGSKDSTLKILEDQKDKRLKVFTIDNSGQNAALNYGFSKCKGTFVKFMDADDLISSEMLEIQVNCLVKHPDCIAYGEWSRFFNNDISTANFEKRHDYYKDMDPIDFLVSDNAGPMLQCAIFLLPYQIVKQAGPWEEQLLLSNDTEFFTRVLIKSKGVKFTNGARLYYRSGINTSLTNQKQKKFFDATFIGFKLIEKNLLAVENSKRTRCFLANLYQTRVYDMFPQFKDLEKSYNREIKKLGGSNLKYKSGKLFNALRTAIGWKLSLRIKQLFSN